MNDNKLNRDLPPRDAREAKDVKRIPLAKQNILSFASDKEFAQRVVNEYPGEIDRYRLAGWEVVQDTSVNQSDSGAGDATMLGSVNRPVVNKSPNAACRHAVLMRKPLKWYEEDTAAKQAENDEIERRLNPAKYKQGDSDYGSMSIRNGASTKFEDN